MQEGSFTMVKSPRRKTDASKAGGRGKAAGTTSGRSLPVRASHSGPSPEPPSAIKVVKQGKTRGATRTAPKSHDKSLSELPTDDPSSLMGDSSELDAGVGSKEAVPLHLRLCQRLRETRRKLGWTLEQASSSSEVSRSMISQIERGLANPTLAVAYRLATAYGLSLGELVDPPGQQPRINVVRGGDRRAMFRNDRQCCVRTLSPLSLEKDVEFYEVTIHAGQRMSSSPHFRETREFVTVERGTLEVISGDERVRLETGDSAQYPADVPHELINPGDSETVAFLVVIYPFS